MLKTRFNTTSYSQYFFYERHSEGRGRGKPYISVMKCYNKE